VTRILCFADTQIGVGTVALADQRDVLERIVALALHREVGLVIHGGDVFEGPVVTPEQMRVFLDATMPLREADIPLLVLRGNGRHDSAVRPVHALDVLREVPGIIVSDRPEVVWGAFDSVAVCTLPWVHPGALIATMDGSVDHDLVTAAVTGLLVKIAADLSAAVDQQKVVDVRKILVAHWAITGAALPSGLPAEEMREPVLPWGELDALGFDAIIGAHIHQPQRLDDPDIDSTPGIVLGSPQQLNFGEGGEHGCWIVTLPPELIAPAPEFIPIASRQFVTLDIAPGDDVWEVPEGAYVRARLRLSEDEAQHFDPLELRRALLEAGAVAVRLDIDVERPTRQRAEISEQLGPQEVMALYCDAAGIDDPLRSTMLETIKEWSQE